MVTRDKLLQALRHVEAAHSHVVAMERFVVFQHDAPEARQHLEQARALLVALSAQTHNTGGGAGGPPPDGLY